MNDSYENGKWAGFRDALNEVENFLDGIVWDELGKVQFRQWLAEKRKWNDEQ